MKKKALQPRVFWLSMEWGPYKRGMQPPAPAIARPLLARQYATQPNDPKKPGFFKRLIALILNFFKKSMTRKDLKTKRRGALIPPKKATKATGAEKPVKKVQTPGKTQKTSSASPATESVSADKQATKATGAEKPVKKVQTPSKAQDKSTPLPPLEVVSAEK